VRSAIQIGDVKVTEDDVACKSEGRTRWADEDQVLVDNGPVNTNPINPLRQGLSVLLEKLREEVEACLYRSASLGRAVVKSTTDKKKLIAGIDIIAPDRGTGLFFETLLDAVDRVNRDKTPGFPLILVIGSDVGAENIKDNDATDMQQKIFKNLITIHVVLVTGGSSGSSRSGAQPEIGMTVTRTSGGRFGASAVTRLATLLPEFGSDR
jgi:hypothetical protein